jgi:crossover junction endodeoxyribonuclease RuvC
VASLPGEPPEVAGSRRKGERVRVLGIDPGLERCGFAVLERKDRRTRAVSFGTVTTGSGPVATRLTELATKLRSVIREHAPQTAAIEQLFVNRNLRTAMTVGQASGVALLVVAESGLTIAGYTPTQVKLAVTGTGNAPKQQVGFMVKALVGLPALARPADSADAIAVALCHIHHLEAPRPPGADDAGTVEEEWLRRAAPTSPGLARGRRTGELPPSPAPGVRGQR